MAEALKPINGGGLQLYPFNAHKRWIVTDVNYRDDLYQTSIIKGISPLYREKVPLSQSFQNSLVADDSQLDNTNSNTTSNLAKKEQKVIWSGLNQQFFKHRPNNERDLYVSASIFSVPHQRLGDGILPGSVVIDDKSQIGRIGEHIYIVDRKIDEYHGYLIDTSLNTSSYAPFGDLMGYWGFNDEVVPVRKNFDKKIEDRSGYQNHAVGKSLEYRRGIKTTGTASLTSGTKVVFNGTDSYIKIKNTKRYSPVKGNDYSISLWTEMPVSQSDVSSTYNWILNKNGSYNEEFRTRKKNNIATRQRNNESSIFPYDLKVYNQSAGVANSGKLVASLSDGLRNVEVTSSTKINDGNQHHIVFNKKGSNLELWVDGTKEGTTPIKVKEIWNEYDVVLGSKYISDVGRYGMRAKTDRARIGTNYNSLTGSLDELRYYRRALTTSEIKGLSSNDWNTGSAYQEDIVGEVFYNHGIVVVSDPRPKYKNVLVGDGNWDYDSTNRGFTAKYKSTKKLYETSVVCEVGASEFNISTNPSLRKNNDIREMFLKPFVTGSDFSPYFTQIGLYNKEGDLIAIGKLASAIQNRNDVDISVKVRLDMDGPFGTPHFSASKEDSDLGNKAPKARQQPHILQKRPDGKFRWNPQGF
jgi:hypothetical protein